MSSPVTFLLLLLLHLHLITFTTSIPRQRHPHPSHSPSPKPLLSTTPNNNTTTAAINAQSIEGVRSSATTLNYLVPALAIITCAITLAVLYVYANTTNPYRPYVTGASLSDYSLPGNQRDPSAAALSRRYHATSLDPNAVPVPQVPLPPATSSETPQNLDVQPSAFDVLTPPSRARLQLDENELSFARANKHISPVKPR